MSKVGLKYDEYDVYENRIREIHNENIDQLQMVLGQLSEILGEDNSFFVKQVSFNIQRLCGRIGSAINRMETVYETHREIIKLFRDSIDNIDTPV